MKNLLYIIIGAIFCGSCKKDFLYLSPETYQSSASFFTTEKDFKQALVAAYTNLRGFVTTDIHMEETRSDNTYYAYGQGGPANWYDDIANFIDQSATTYTNDNYYNAYQGISKVNVILTRIEKVSINQGVKDSILGEALFLRAYYYFNLVKHFGGVPLHIKEVISEAQAFLPRAPVNDVYNQIIADLTTAIPKLTIAQTFPQSGRATKGAAKMLLAYVYMTKPSREYAKAESELREITNMQYSLLPNYANVFSPTNKNNSESIFEVQYKEGTQGQQSSFIYIFIPRTNNTQVLTGVASNNLTIGGWNVPTKEMVDSYETGDLRLGISVGVIEGNGTQDANNFVYTDAKNIVGYTPVAGKTYYYYIKKYLHSPYVIPLNTGENFPVYRYADALLLLAECLVEQNKNNDALPFINQVRTRAGLPNLLAVTKADIVNERRHELAFENHRWSDLIRTGKAIEVMTAYAVRMKILYPTLSPTMFNITEFRLLYPIPYRELVLNHNLVQNPGY